MSDEADPATRDPRGELGPGTRPGDRHLTRSIVLIDGEGKMTHVIPYDDRDRRYQTYVGLELGSTAATKADRTRLLRAYGEAHATGKRQTVRYESKAAGGRSFQFHIYRFPPTNIVALMLSAELPEGDRSLSERELEVLRLAADDATDEEIAESLGIAKPTVSRHKQNIRAKLGVREWAAAVVRADRAGLL